jgi:ribosomal protein S18 acetylase RimI-like enzyme
MMATLRRLAPADLGAILTIQQTSPEAAQWPGAEWQAFFACGEVPESAKLLVGHCAWVAETDGATVGFLAALFSGEEIEILNLAVLPVARKARVASSLLEAALAVAQGSGGKRAFLEVRASNAGAIAFYERHGFLLAGRRAAYYAAPVEDALVFSRAL